MIGQLYPSLNARLTAGNPSLEWFRGSRGDLEPTIPAVSNPEELVEADEKELRKFWRGFRMKRNPRQNFLSSFSSASTNSSGLDTAGIVGSKSPLDPRNHSSDGLPAVTPGFRLGYNWPIMAMMGIVSEVDATFNFDKTGTALQQGAPLKRRFAADEYELYLQDSYRIRPNLTITYGLRYSLFSPPWEATGTEVTPQGFPAGGGGPVTLGQWFQQRASKMLTGGSSVTDPLLTSNLAGPANGKPDRKSTRLNSSHSQISYAVFCLKKKNKDHITLPHMNHTLC